jgi:hypothetical protein
VGFATWRKRMNWWVIVSFATVALAMGGLAYYLGSKSFPESGYIPKQILVTVYVKVPARVIIRSFINEGAPRDDLIVVSIIEPKGKVDPSLLVVQCTNGSQYLRQHEKELISETAQGPTQTGVIIKSYTQDNWKSFLDCLAPPKSTAYQLSGPSSAAVVNLALPVLEAIPAGQVTQTPAPLYAEERHGQITDIVDVAQAPGSNCPVPASASPSPTLRPSGAGSGQGTPSTSRSPHSAVPTSSPATPHCFPFHTAPTLYFMPKQVKTIETLQNINLTGDQIDSMFPPGQVEHKDHIVWQDGAGLSPTLSATNLPSERVDNVYIFFAGITAGLAVSVLLAIAQGMFSFTKDDSKGHGTAKDRRTAADRTGQIGGETTGTGK